MPKDKWKVSEKLLIQDRLAYAALLGLCIVIVVQLLGQAQLDRPLIISLYCFSFAIPSLAASLLIFTVQSHYEYGLGAWYIPVFGILGGLGAFIGINSIFFHFAWAVGMIFFVASGFACMCVASHLGSIEEINEQGQ